MNKKTLNDVILTGMRVILRADFNVPLDGTKITDDNRIQATLPTIHKILEQNPRYLLIMSHLGRVKTLKDKTSQSLLPISKHLAKLLGKPVVFIPATSGNDLKTQVSQLPVGAIALMENTRFEDLPDNRESGNDPKLAQEWANLADVFVNDAFGTAHRAHASNVGIASFVKINCVGLLMQSEISMLDQALNHFQHPFVVILGGAKVSDKINVIQNFLTKCDYLLIAGAMSYTFLKAQGYQVGTSKVELDQINLAKEFLAKGAKKIILPVDHAVAERFADIPATITPDQNIPAQMMGLDIGPKTSALFAKYIATAKTVIWNGPAGVFEFKHFQTGTVQICKALADLYHNTGAFTVIGGGDSAAAAIQLGFKNSFSFISTGGGASLEFLEGKTLPGIAVIQNQNT